MTKQLSTVGEFSQEDLQVMKQTLAAGTTDAQFQLFVRTAAAAGLNPFLSHIYAIVYGNKMSLQISVEGIHYLAKQKDGYLGTDAQTVHENDDFKATRNKDGEWVIEKHDVTFPRGKTIAAYAVAYREGFKPYTVLMDVDEVQHHLTGTNGANWKKYFNDFFKKTVLKRALKGQFGIDISEDEISTGNTIDSIPEREVVDVTPQAQEATQDAPKRRTNTNTPHEQQSDSTDAMSREKARLQRNFASIGLTSKEDKAQYIESRLQLGGKAPTVQQLIGLNEALEAEIELATMPEDLPL